MPDTQMETRTEASPWLIKEVMPDGSVYWTIRVWFGPIMDGPNYYGPFDTSDEAQYFYHNRIVDGLLDFAMELVNVRNSSTYGMPASKVEQEG